MIVVSRMGEQWSPITAPARHADTPMMIRCSLRNFDDKAPVAGSVNTPVTIGIEDTEGSQLVPEASQEARYQEDDRGKHFGQSRRCTLHQTCHIDIRT